MEPKLAKQLANPMLVRGGTVASARWREGKGRGMAQQEKHADLAINSSSQSKLMTFQKNQPQKIIYKSLKSHLKCVPLLPYPFSGTVILSKCQVQALAELLPGEQDRARGGAISA